MLFLKNGTLSVGAENSYQNWLCRFKDAAKEKMTDLEMFMFVRKINDSGIQANVDSERISKDIGNILIETNKVLFLNCACCGGEALALKQWFNQDEGFSVCVDCFKMHVEKHDLKYAENLFGIAGINHSIK